ncbi:MAG: hypothetical protein LBM74_07545 [Oscillospiraceae bacterium]|jgi:hypothetical protein|nr:hypothetical protein [Oscillospiraceae bacterium]
MQNQWIRRLRAAAVGGLLGLMAAYPQEAMAAARDACRLWAAGVMPALFPYMVFSQLLMAALRGRWLLAPLAMLGGSPAGSRLIALSQLPRPKAQALAALCATASPLFILGTLSGGARMLAAHWLGAVCAYGAVRLLQARTAMEAPIPVAAMAAPLPRAGLTESIRDAALAMINVCGCMALFSVVSALLVKLLPLPPSGYALLSAILEMASGCARVQGLGLPVAMTAPLLCATVSFGGLSVFMQNAVFLKPAGVNLRVQFAARCLHALAAGGICALLYRL